MLLVEKEIPLGFLIEIRGMTAEGRNFCRNPGNDYREENAVTKNNCLSE